MAQDWQRLADYIGREMAERGWNRSDLAAAAGVGARTVTRLLGGELSKLPYTTAKIERALDWEPGTARLVLMGGTPEGTISRDDYDRAVDELLREFDSLPPRHQRRVYREVMRAWLDKEAAADSKE